MKTMTNHAVLDLIVQTVPYIKQIVEVFEDDFTMGIADREKFLHYAPGTTLNFGLKENDAIKEGSIVNAVIQSGKVHKKIMDKDVYGIVYLAGGVPIYDEQRGIIGAIAIGVSMEREHTLSDISEKLSAYTEEVAANSNHISRTAHKLAEKNKDMSQFMLEMKEQIKKTSEITTIIRQIADQTSLLGLNASIEAAHAKEYGKGFDVVAKEIRKLASHASESSKTIITILENLEHKIHDLSQHFLESDTISREQFDGINELAQTLDSVSQEAQQLAEFANIHTDQSSSPDDDYPQPRDNGMHFHFRN